MTTEHYVHIVAAPGRSVITPPLLNVEADNSVEGMCLFMSTSTHRLYDYIFLHSVEEYGLGLALSSWCYRGTLGSNGYLVQSSSIFNIAGTVYTEGFLCKNDHGYVDLYVRASTSCRTRFVHYHLNDREPELWWSATVCEYQKPVQRPDLADLVASL